MSRTIRKAPKYAFSRQTYVKVETPLRRALRHIQAKQDREALREFML